MNFENTLPEHTPGVSPIRMVQMPQPSTLCRPTLVRPPTPVVKPTPVRPPTPQPDRPILLLQRSQHPSSLLTMDQLIHPTPTQPSTSMTRSSSPHEALLQPWLGAMSSSSSSPHSTVVQPSSRHSPSSTSRTSAKVARGRGGGTKRTAQKNGNSGVSKRSYQPLTKAYTWAGKYFAFAEWSQKYVYLSDLSPTVTEVIPLQEDPLAVTQLC